MTEILVNALLRVGYVHVTQRKQKYFQCHAQNISKLKGDLPFFTSVPYRGAKFSK